MVLNKALIGRIATQAETVGNGIRSCILELDIVC